MSDQIVSARDVLRALLRVRREGARRLLRDVERHEADLRDFLSEELTALHGLLAKSAVPPTDARRIYRRIEAGALVLILTLQNAHHRLWEEDLPGTPLARLAAGTEPLPPDEPSSKE